MVKQGPQQNPYANGESYILLLKPFLCLRPAEPEEVVRKVKKDPMAEVTGDAPDKWDKVVAIVL